MGKRVEIEDIEEMRRRVGVDDVELWVAIRGLRTGDYVRLTFLSSAEPPAAQTLRVRITRIRGTEFRGKLADKPAFRGLSGLKVGSGVAFTASHIHSLADGPRAPQQPAQRRPGRRPGGRGRLTAADESGARGISR
jgi:hypothetical protein